MKDKTQGRLPEANKIMNALKATIDIIHSLCGKSDAVAFRKDLATLIAIWAARLNNNTETDNLPF